MGFKLLTPAAKVKPGVFRVSTIKSGRSEIAPWRLLISVPTAEFYLKFGDCDQFDISIGDGVDLGKLLIAPRPEGGAFKATRLKSCVLFRLPPMETTPEMEFRGEDPERRMTADGLVVTLPAWAWEPGRWQQIRDARALARRQDAVAAGRKG